MTYRMGGGYGAGAGVYEAVGLKAASEPYGPDGGYDRSNTVDKPIRTFPCASKLFWFERT